MRKNSVSLLGNAGLCLHWEPRVCTRRFSIVESLYLSPRRRVRLSLNALSSRSNPCYPVLNGVRGGQESRSGVYRKASNRMSKYKIQSCDFVRVGVAWSSL